MLGGVSQNTVCSDAFRHLLVAVYKRPCYCYEVHRRHLSIGRGASPWRQTAEFFFTMRRKFLYGVFFLIILALLHQSTASKKKVVIHVPYRVKNVKHTHTIYKLISHHKHRKQDYDEDYD